MGDRSPSLTAPIATTQRRFFALAFFGLFLLSSVLSGESRSIPDSNLVLISNPIRPACRGSNCTVWITANASSCPTEGFCYRTLNEAANNIAKGQVITILDTVLRQPSVAQFEYVDNITIQAKTRTLITPMVPGSPYGQHIWFTAVQDVLVRNLSFQGLITTSAPLYAMQSENVTFEGIQCSHNHVRAPDNHLPIIAPCISLFRSNAIISGLRALSNRLHTVSENTAGGSAGVCCMDSKLWLADSHFEENYVSAVSGSGGAVYASKCELQVSNSFFLNNGVHGEIQALGGAIYVEDGSLVVMSSNFTLNRLTLSSEVGGNGAGGAITVKAPYDSPTYEPRSVVIANSIFYRNSIRGLGNNQGGAAFIAARSVVLNGNSWLMNLIEQHKSGPQFASSVALAIRGGAARIFAHDIYITRDLFQSNSIFGIHGFTPGNAFGGALDISSDPTEAPFYVGPAYPRPRLSITYTNFSNNVAMGGDSFEQSAGANSQGGALNIAGIGSHIFITSCMFISNIAFGGNAPTTGGMSDGGAAYIVQLKRSEDSEPIASPYPPIIITGTAFYNNDVRGGVGAMLGGTVTGGALYIEARKLRMKQCEFHSNAAIGGGVNSTWSGSNSGGYAKGGAIHLHESTHEATFQNVIFTYNLAEGGFGTLERNEVNYWRFARGGMGFGGGVSAWTENTLMRLSFLECDFTENSAVGGMALESLAGEGFGGGLWAYNADITECFFEHNDATSGAAAYAINLYGYLVFFHENDASADFDLSAFGGAVFAFKSTFVNSMFIHNQAAAHGSGEAHGGAIYSSNQLTMVNCTVKQNFVSTHNAKAYGGGLAAHGFSNISNSLFRNNDATAAYRYSIGLGGSIYLDYNLSVAHLDNVKIMFSNACYGAGIYANGLSDTHLHMSSVTLLNNTAGFAGGALALLPTAYLGGPSPDICPTCVFENNTGHLYGDNIILPFMVVEGKTVPRIYPGLPFFANFSQMDWALNHVKLELEQRVSGPLGVLFVSGSSGGQAIMDVTTGIVSWREMIAWGRPGTNFSLEFTTFGYLHDLVDRDYHSIIIHVPYSLSDCPPGYQLEDTESSHVGCQPCLSGLYSFGNTGCLPCPGDTPCVLAPETKNNHNVYKIGAGYMASPLVNPVAILQCPFASNYVNGLPQSSCLASTCVIDCGALRTLNSSTTNRLSGNTSCITDCSRNVSCATGHTGFLCSKCICNRDTCYYADEGCRKCHGSWVPTIAVVAVAFALFILFKRTLLILFNVMIFIAVFTLMFMNLISTIIPGVVGTAFIIFAEAKLGSSSGLIKSFVFFMQTASVFISQDIWPTQLAVLVQFKSLAQLRVVGLECLEPAVFGEPLKRFFLSMLLPIGLLIIAMTLYWLRELFGLVNFLRALQHFDPIASIPFFQRRHQASERRASIILNSQYTLLAKDEPVVNSGSDSAFAMDGTSYLSDSTIGESDDESQPVDSRRMPCRQFVLRMNQKLGRLAIFVLFAAHFELCNRVFQVFAPCISAPSEGFSYSSAYPWLVCSSPTVSYLSLSTTHGKLVLSGIFFGALYVIGIPAFFGVLLYRNRRRIKAGDQSIAWMGLLYNSYRPSMLFFEVAWLLRRVCLSAAISLLPRTFVSHTLVPIGILFLSLVLQRSYKPFLAKDDNNMEIASLLSIIFMVACNFVVSQRQHSADNIVWRWFSFLLVSATALTFLFKLVIQPIITYMKEPKDD